MEGIIDNNRRARKILNALNIDNGPEEGIRAIVTIIKSKTFHPLLKKLNLYTNNFIINSTTKIDKAILST